MALATPYSSHLNRFSRVGALSVALVGGGVLVGWLLDIGLLKSVMPGFVTMKPNTASGFLAAGGALWFLQNSTGITRTIRHSVVLSIIVIGIGGLTLVEYFLGIDLRIDQFLLADDLEALSTLHPGRMSPATALNFCLIGFALLALAAQRERLASSARRLAVAALLVSVLAIVGYAYGVSSLYRVGEYTSMAAHTAVSFLVLALALLAADQKAGVGRIVASPTDGGIVARRLLPTLPLILFLIGGVCLVGQQLGFYDTRFGLALMVLVSMTVTVFAIASTAAALHHVDLKRQAAVAETFALNAELERRVRERTQAFEESLAQVQQLRGLLPICAWCKKIRDDRDYWQTVEDYVGARTDARFSHGICPDCQQAVRRNR